jgi:hypothetical protein
MILPISWRIEIETALNRKISIVPILVQDAAMPSNMTLPDNIRRITGLQAARVRRDPDFHRDMEQVIASISSKLR